MVLFMNTIPLYWNCPTCGASLDPGEKCDCDESRSKDTNNYKSVERGDDNNVSSKHESQNVRMPR